MIAFVSVIISVSALSFSFAVFLDNRNRDRRDIFLKMHELLISDDLQRGRYVLFQKITDEGSIERLTDGEWQDVNRALSTFNALGLYMVNRYVREQDVMDTWAHNICTAWKAAKPFISYRERLQGYPAWMYFAILADKAQQHLIHKGFDADLRIYRRNEDAACARSSIKCEPQQEHEVT
jgi:hypothetical protein